MSTRPPSNTARFSPDELRVATGGTLVQRGEHDAVGVCTDTRAIVDGNAFLALRGPRFDGHAFVPAAIAQGARSLIVDSHTPAPADVTVVRVDDTTLALGALARAHRRRWRARSPNDRRTVIAVAGSAGKTTTRRAIATLLGQLGAEVHFADGNFNNAIGIPLVLLGLADHHDTAVIEIGTSSPGEVAYGASLVEPDVGVLTLIAVEHSEGLGDIDAIAHEEGQLLATLPRDGVAIVNGDDKRCLAQLLRSPAASWVVYGKRAGADVRIALRSPNGARGNRLALTLRNHGLRGFLEHTTEVTLAVDTPLLGEAGAYATVAAVAVTCTLYQGGISGDAVTAALAPLASQRDPGRLVPYECSDGLVVIDDSYNANAASTEAGIAAAGEVANDLGRRLVLVLGEMLELGDLAAEEHERVGDIAAQARAAEVVAVGGKAQSIAARVIDSGGSARFVADAPAAIAVLSPLVEATDVVLIKGSRGVGLDAVVRELVRLHDR